MSEPQLIYTQNKNHHTLTLKNSSRVTVDAFVTAVQGVLEESQTNDTPFSILLDFSAHDVGLTPYLREAALRVIELAKPHQGRLAVVVATALGQAAVSLILMRRTRSFAFQPKIFTSASPALEWLEAAQYIEREDHQN